MGKIVRMISADGSVVCSAIDSTDIAARAEQIHKTSAVVTAALGRTLTASSLMGCMLKGEKDSLTLRIAGDGPVGAVIAVADSSGNCKGYVENPVVELPLNNYGKLDVAGAVGKNGYLQIMRDMGMKEPYMGQSPIVSGEIAEDITHYYAMSEQTPTVCALGVLVNPNLTVKAAGGYLIQLLPFADEKAIDILENTLSHALPVSTMIDQGMSAADICTRMMEGLEPELLDEFEVSYRCDCSRERVEKALITLGVEQLSQIADEDEVTEVNCHFCPHKHRFNRQEIRALVKQAKE